MFSLDTGIHYLTLLAAPGLHPVGVQKHWLLTSANSTTRTREWERHLINQRPAYICTPGLIVLICTQDTDYDSHIGPMSEIKPAEFWLAGHLRTPNWPVRNFQHSVVAERDQLFPMTRTTPLIGISDQVEHKRHRLGQWRPSNWRAFPTHRLQPLSWHIHARFPAWACCLSNQTFRT